MQTGRYSQRYLLETGRLTYFVATWLIAQT